MAGPRARTSRPHRPPPSMAVGEKRIPESYIVILQPTVTPYEMLSSVLKGYKPTFTYGSIFTGFAVDRVPLHKADEVGLYRGNGTLRSVCGLLNAQRSTYIPREGLRCMFLSLCTEFVIPACVRVLSSSF